MSKKMTIEERLAKALADAENHSLIVALLELAKGDHRITRRLECAFNVEVPTEEIVAAVRRGIAAATNFDRRDANRNFSYDHEAYQDVARDLKILLAMGRFDEAMVLSIELMDKGSCQVEASDEGAMTEEIEQCLRMVIDAVDRESALPTAKLKEWCAALLKKNRVGFICDSELREFQKQFSVV